MRRGAFAAIVVALAAWTVVMCVLEPILFDGWFIEQWRGHGGGFADYVRQNWTGELVWGNPRIGQWATYATYDRAWHVVITPLLIVALFLLLLVHARGRWPDPARDAWLLLVLVGLAVLGQPQLGPVLFYRPFTANYVVGLVLQLAWLVPYRFALARDPGRRFAAGKTLGLLVLGALAGACNEHTGPALVVAAGVACVWLARRGRLRAWHVVGLVAFVAGYLAMMTAPAQATRYCGVGEGSLVDRLAGRSLIGTLQIVGGLVIGGRWMWVALAAAWIAARVRGRTARTAGTDVASPGAGTDATSAGTDATSRAGATAGTDAVGATAGTAATSPAGAIAGTAATSSAGATAGTDATSPVGATAGTDATSSVGAIAGTAAMGSEGARVASGGASGGATAGAAVAGLAVRRAALLWIALGAAIALTLLLSPKQGDRLLFAALAFASLGAAAILDALAAGWPRLRTAIAIAALGACGFGAARSIAIAAQVAAETSRREATLAAAAPGTIVAVPPLSAPPSRWFVGDDLTSDSLRHHVAQIYGLAAIDLEGRASIPYQFAIRYELAQDGTHAVKRFIPLNQCEARRAFDGELAALQARHGRALAAAELAIVPRAPVLGGTPLASSRWRGGRLIAPRAMVVNELGTRYLTIERGGLEGPLDVTLVGPDRVLHLTEEAGRFPYKPWGPGTYWVIACTGGECYLADTIRHKNV